MSLDVVAVLQLLVDGVPVVEVRACRVVIVSGPLVDFKSPIPQQKNNDNEHMCRLSSATVSTSRRPYLTP